MKFISLFLLSLLPLFSHALSVTDSDAQSALDNLDIDIKHRSSFISLRKARIDSLKSIYHHAIATDSIIKYALQLGEEYSTFNNDSSLRYYTKGYDLAEQNKLTRDALILRIKRAVNLPLSGFITDGYNEYNDINPESVPTELLPFYYESGRQLCSYISSFYQGNESGQWWKSRAMFYQQKYLELNPVNDPLYTLNVAEDLIAKGQKAQAQGLLEDYITQITANSNLYARACYQLAILARDKGNRNAEIYYLAESAQADLHTAVLEAMSLQVLGKIMYDDGDINRAYDYLSTALLNSVDCNASSRILETSSVLPIIQAAHNEQIQKWKSRMYLVIIMLCLFIVAMIVGLFYLRYQIHRTSVLKDHLQSANQLKDIYISQFFRLSSIYVEKMNQLCRTVNRKISSGQVDELFKMTKSNKFIEEQTQDFYNLFDDAFLHIYPEFVTRVNDLLTDKIILKDGELLNNELRILAFMRLGLEDTAQVAQILNYSVNTIYAYRNKLRNRAIDRDNFEHNIMLIPSI